MEGNQFRCAYCGHLSLPPRPQVDPAQRAALLASLLSGFETRRTSARGARAELRKREHDAMASGRRVNGLVMLGIGGLFLLFAVACFVGAGGLFFSHGSAVSLVGHHHGHAALPPVGPSAASVAGFPLVFGLFWLGLGGLLFYIGVRYRRAGARDKRMRESGLRGRATVRSYKESSVVVDGNSKFELVLEVEVPGRDPFVVRQSDYVPHPWAVTTGADLPVFVDPGNPNDVMVDWFTLDG
jgi:hypothetical protein